MGLFSTNNCCHESVTAIFFRCLAKLTKSSRRLWNDPNKQNCKQCSKGLGGRNSAPRSHDIVGPRVYEERENVGYCAGLVR